MYWFCQRSSKDGSLDNSLCFFLKRGQRKYEMIVACSSSGQPGELVRTIYQSLILCVIGNLKTIFAKSICLYLRIEIMTWLWLVAVVSRED